MSLTALGPTGYNVPVGTVMPAPNLDKCKPPHEVQRMGELNMKTTTLLDYVKSWMATAKKRDVKPATYDRLVTSLSALSSYAIASKPVLDITTDDCEAYVDEITARGYAMTTIKKQILIVSAPLRYAYEHRQIPFNPAQCMKPPSKVHVQKAKKKIVAYDQKEQQALLDGVGAHPMGALAAIAFMMETGLRPGEALALNWDDVDLRHSCANIHATVVNLANRNTSYVQEGAKSESSNRPVPLSPKAKALLQDMQPRAKHDWVFDNSDGIRLTYESLRYQCQMLCKRTKVLYHGLHVFRHTFATNMYYKGVNVKILSQILGHSNVSVTMNIYVHLYGDGFQELLNAVS